MSDNAGSSQLSQPSFIGRHAMPRLSTTTTSGAEKSFALLESTYAKFAAAPCGSSAVVLVAILVAVLVAGLAMILRRSMEGGPRRAPGETPDGAGKEAPAGNAWRDKFMIPLLVSIASGVAVAVVLYLLGIK